MTKLNPTTKLRLGSEFHYSGKSNGSRQFWGRVNALPWETSGKHIYALGCALQDLEWSVQRELREAEREHKADPPSPHPEVQHAPGWISAEERMPDGYVECLVCYFGHSGTVVEEGRYCGNGKWLLARTDSYDEAISVEPTHWMPMPLPPALAQEVKS
jgi:hypothetical protein